MKMNLKAEHISQVDPFCHRDKRQLGQLTTANFILPVLLIAQTTDNIIFLSVSARK